MSKHNMIFHISHVGIWIIWILNVRIIPSQDIMIIYYIIQANIYQPQVNQYRERRNASQMLSLPYTKKFNFKYTTLKFQMQQTNARLLTAHDWNLTSCKLLLLWSFCLSYVCYTIIPGISWCWWVQTPANKKIEEICCLEKNWAKTTI